ncbi:MAG: helix-turn-helix transcriptional regulator, partial [Bacteroidales bacterium]|nr:helix-turn-helix transcriptional regulator [Bacteroidales bacterium]
KSDVPSLTERELEILPMIAAGMTSKEIASKLYLTQQTIKWRRQRLLEKLDAKNTAEMLAKAKEYGLL